MDWNWGIIGVIATGFILLVALGTAVFKAGTWVGNMNAMKTVFTGFMQEIRDDIKKIFSKLPSDTLQATSPLRLSDKGKGVSSKTGAAAWAKLKAEELPDKDVPQTAYDIQAFCFDLIRAGDFDPGEELKSKMKTAAFEHGTSIADVENVLAIELRDELLKRRGLEAPE